MTDDHQRHTPRLPPVELVGGLGLGVTGAIFASEHVSPLLIWGGMDCETSGGIQGCFGYPPSGIMVFLIAGALLGSYVHSWRRSEDE